MDRNCADTYHPAPLSLSYGEQPPSAREQEDAHPLGLVGSPLRVYESVGVLFGRWSVDSRFATSSPP